MHGRSAPEAFSFSAEEPGQFLARKFALRAERKPDAISDRSTSPLGSDEFTVVETEVF
jgi:hypothetical protein